MNMEEWRLCLKKKFNMHFHVKEGARFKKGRENKGASAPGELSGRARPFCSVRIERKGILIID